MSQLDDYLELVRAMAYGPSQGEYGHDQMFGPLGQLQPGDVALSPNLQKRYPLGSSILVHPENGTPFLARVADSSYFGPGKPTRNTIEFWNGQDLGHVRIGAATPSALQKYGMMQLADDRKDLLNDIDNAIYGGGQAPPPPTPTPTPAPQRMAGSMSSGMQSSWADYAKMRQTQDTAQGIGAIFAKLGQGMQSQGQAGMEQALRMLQSGTGSNPLAQLLQQLANNPTMYLQQGPIT